MHSHTHKIVSTLNNLVSQIFREFCHTMPWYFIGKCLEKLLKLTLIHCRWKCTMLKIATYRIFEHIGFYSIRFDLHSCAVFEFKLFNTDKLMIFYILSRITQYVENITNEEKKSEQQATAEAVTTTTIPAVTLNCLEHIVRALGKYSMIIWIAKNQSQLNFHCTVPLANKKSIYA